MKYKYKIPNKKSLTGGANNAAGGNNKTGGATNNAGAGAAGNNAGAGGTGGAAGNNAGAAGTSGNNAGAAGTGGTAGTSGNNAGAAGTGGTAGTSGNNAAAGAAGTGGNNAGTAGTAGTKSNNAPAGNNAGAAGTGGNNAGSRRNNMSNALASGLGKASNMSNRLVGKASNMLSKGRNTAKATVGKIYTYSQPFYADSITKVIMMVILIAVFYGFLVLMKYIIKKFYEKRNKSVPLYDDNKVAQHNYIIPNDLILRSVNQDGMEFTYSFWICIMGLKYKDGEWKHIMHKGSPTSYPHRAPGVWLHPTKNSLRVYMNTFDEINEYVDIDDIPIKKWVCVQLVLQNINSHTTPDEDIVDLDNNQVLDVYINGQNKKTMIFNSVPKQNNGDLYLNINGGYDGFFSRLKYFPYATDFKQIGSLVKEGPSQRPTGTGEIPPYLNDSWWFDYNPDTEYQI